MPFFSRAIPAAGAAGSLLASEDVEAGFLTAGARGARDKIAYDPSAKGNSFIKLGIAKAPDGSGMSTNDKLDVLIENMQGLELKDQAKMLESMIHNKSNYEQWMDEVYKRDGGPSGPAFRDGLDAFLEDIIERRPELANVAQQYAMHGPNARLTRSPEQVKQRSHQTNIWKNAQRKGFEHNATAAPRVTRRAAPAVPAVEMGQGSSPLNTGDYLQARLHNRQQKIAEHMDNLGLTPDPMYEYGDLLPRRKHLVTGEEDWGMANGATPNVVRWVAEGLLGLGMTPETGIYDVNNLWDIAL